MIGIGNAFQNPASEVTVSLIVSKDNYIKTSALRTLCNCCTGILHQLLLVHYMHFGD